MYCTIEGTQGIAHVTVEWSAGITSTSSGMCREKGVCGIGIQPYKYSLAKWSGRISLCTDLKATAAPYRDVFKRWYSNTFANFKLAKVGWILPKSAQAHHPWGTNGRELEQMRSFCFSFVSFLETLKEIWHEQRWGFGFSLDDHLRQTSKKL